MPTQQASIEQVEKLRTQAAERARTVADYSGVSETLSDQVMKAVRADRANRGVSQMATDVGNVTGQLATDPALIRGRAGDIVNPLDVDVLTAKQRGQNLQTLGTLSTVEKERGGTLQESIQAGANQLKSMALQKQAEAQEFANKADAMMGTLNYQMDVRRQEFAEREAGRKGKTGVNPYKATGAKLLETAGAPLYTPLKEGATSEDGEWVYQSGQWVPTQQGQASIVYKAFQSGGVEAAQALGELFDVLNKVKTLNKEDKDKDSELEKLEERFGKPH